MYFSNNMAWSLHSLKNGILLTGNLRSEILSVYEQIHFSSGQLFQLLWLGSLHSPLRAWSKTCTIQVL